MNTTRLASLDALRGFDMLFIMGGEGLVYAVAAALGHPDFKASFGHVEWHGLQFMDVIFPLFLFMAGVSFPFSCAKSREKGLGAGSIALKALKRKPGRDDVRVYNRNAGPKVSIDRIYSVSTPDKDTLVFGDDIVLEGENLYFLEDLAATSDSITVGYYTQNRRGPMTMSSAGIMDGSVSDDGRQMVLSWDGTVGQILDANKGRPDADPAQNPPVAVMVVLRSRGGISTAKQQLHRARAFFDTWKEKYPKFNEPWAEDEDDELRKMAEDGIAPRQMAEQLQRTLNSVRLRLQKLGLWTPKPAAKPWSPAEEEMVAGMYKAGAPFEEMAATTGRSVTAIVTRLVRLHLAQLE